MSPLLHAVRAYLHAAADRSPAGQVTQREALAALDAAAEAEQVVSAERPNAICVSPAIRMETGQRLVLIEVLGIDGLGIPIRTNEARELARAILDAADESDGATVPS